nr:hypothetical protein [uncultured Dysosmobacter sp.]
MNKYDVRQLTAEQLEAYRDAGLLEVLDLPLDGMAYAVLPNTEHVVEMKVDAVYMSPYKGVTYSLYTWLGADKYALDVTKPYGMVWPTLAEALQYCPDHTLIPFSDRPTEPGGGYSKYRI